MYKRWWYHEVTEHQDYLVAVHLIMTYRSFSNWRMIEAVSISYNSLWLSVFVSNRYWSKHKLCIYPTITKLMIGWPYSKNLVHAPGTSPVTDSSQNSLLVSISSNWYPFLTVLRKQWLLMFDFFRFSRHVNDVPEALYSVTYIIF